MRKHFGIVCLTFFSLLCLGCSQKPVELPSDKFPPDTYVSFPQGNAELLRLSKLYETKHSWHYEEWFIRDFFKNKKDGFFVDVGAWEPIERNNTYFLEKEMGWSGIAIDAQVKFAESYAETRPKTKFFAYFVGEVSKGKHVLNVPEDDTKATGTDYFKNEKTSAEEVEQITLDLLLEREGVEKVDFINIDIEFWELGALRGFDLEKYRPELICVETFPPNREAVEKHLVEHGYEEISLWTKIDTHNLYYKRKEVER